MIELVLSVGLAFIMLSLGLSLQPADFGRALGQPRALMGGALAQLILLPFVAFGLLRLFGLTGDLALGVMILSCCPGGITSNVMTRLSRGDVALSISYTALASLVTAFTLPVVLSLTAPLLLTSQTLELSILPLSLKVFSISTVPVVIGVWIAQQAPGFCKRNRQKAERLANLLFVLIVAGTLISQWSVFTSNLTTIGPTLLALNLLMLAIGLSLGNLLKMPTEQTTSLSIEAGFQNGTVGIVVGSLLGPDLMQSQLNSFSLPSAVYGVLMTVTILPFIAWRRSLKPMTTQP
ncbi:sodium/bile acid cotransporter family protein [Synechococcus sp. PROS-7-1]|uniref:bile acid:sodium symporter family protein n=1 Tax=Synechococcus sp. PROS-7-1 TaxID=1442556 RepID=UPI0016458497|nr:bile acid:sodium symporter [Synechococcus sp. PROS-7-1]QNI84281.1 sodium/bile acid cotransporter family protein [Synechococcus sp. PROS-7-1]